MTRVIETVREIRKYVSERRREGKKVGFVPTMGAFHEGHLSLMRASRKKTDVTIVSIFVNPIQFNAGEDYDRYPRNEEQDAKLAEAEGVDVLFIPSVAEIYPKGFDTYVDQDDLGAKLCGPFREGHFRGVQTIVLKLFNMVRPDVTFFGQKDYQQYLILKRMALDLNVESELKMVPIVRDEDGLALSSRNVYLGPKQRKEALCIPRALRKAREMIQDGENNASKVITAIKRTLQAVKGTKIEYVHVVNAETLEDIREIKGRVLIAVAVRFGKTRLIDNLLT